MSAELIAVGVATLGGLCALLWNTDGSLDWLAAVADLVGTFIWQTMVVWNVAVAFALIAARGSVPPAYAEALEKAVQAKLWPTDLMAMLFVVSALLGGLPYLLRAARRARSQP